MEKTLLNLLDLEKPSWTSWIWRKPGDTGENLEILEKTWS